MRGIPRVKIFGFIAGIVAFIVVLQIPIAGIKPQAQGLLALLAMGVAFWVTSPLPMYLTALLCCSLLPWMIKLVPQEVAFSGFAGGVFWFLFGSLGIAGSLSASGVTKRLAFFIMSRLKPQYGRLMLLTFVIMFVLAFIIPAGTARTALVLALVAPLIPALGVPVRSNIGKTVMMSVPILAWAGAVMVVTGGIIPVIAWGTLNKLGYHDITRIIGHIVLDFKHHRRADVAFGAHPGPFRTLHRRSCGGHRFQPGYRHYNIPEHGPHVFPVRCRPLPLSCPAVWCV